MNQQTCVVNVKKQTIGLEDRGDLLISTEPKPLKESAMERYIDNVKSVELAQDFARIENPNKAHFADSDCISCHYASTARAELEQSLRLTSEDFEGQAFRSQFPLENKHILPALMLSLHNFGYKSAQASISQRTINESAAVAAWINSHLLQ